ncbi:glycine cleavage system aminomethyltransferase GcvT [bacterium]|nr:glycine cleavage system aminomethyltransferase GcvT [bacterium]
MTKRTALYNTHVRLGGKIVEFAGYDLPIQYGKGIIAEHNAVRVAAGLFDVSHMGEVMIEGENATAALQHLVTNKVSTMAENQCRYTLMCYEDGGLVDDLLIYKYNNNKYLLVVNASNTDKDYEWMESNLTSNTTITNISDNISQIALQGPLSRKVLEKLTDISLIPVKNYYFIDGVSVGGIKCLVSTTGYTGEAGYELYVNNDKAEELYALLLDAGQEFGIEPIGLGARDTLRFESSMPLYGHELTAETKANEVGLDMFVKTEEGFIGKAYIINNAPQYERRGLKLVDRGIAREHCDIYNINGELIGNTSSGGPCPTIGGAYAMARVKKGISDSEIYIDVRGRKLKAEWTSLPFYKRNK